MDMPQPGVTPHTYWLVQNENAEPVEGGVIEESLISVYVNGQEVVTVMCSPLDQEALAVGFLYNEGVIASAADVGLVQANVFCTVVDVLLKDTFSLTPRRMIITSGCGGGVTWQDLSAAHPALETDFTTSPPVISDRMRDLQGEARLYHQVRGVHTAGLADAGQILVNAEDVGRHNAVDKVTGKALLTGIEMQDKILLTSGRISSEMLVKARQMGVPMVISRTSPTSISVQLAQAWNICLVGYVRQGGMRIYTHPWRLGIVTAVPTNP
ncbi:MAG: formate dehydrogenase accessory sulfurtransferase FdhD [Anaerolineaceae bacterium]|nr:formate dehydrogenase accessory sulfurtransferase FdhD [Anaerolineaceae bacterium]